MCVLLAQRQKTSTKPNTYDRRMNISTWILKELLSGLLLNNKSRSSTEEHLLYFKCRGGHITQCNTPKHRLFFCKECNSIIPKKDCDRFTDKTSQIEQRRRTDSKKIRYNNKILYQFPDSARRYYPRHKQKEETTECQS